MEELNTEVKTAVQYFYWDTGRGLINHWNSCNDLEKRLKNVLEKWKILFLKVLSPLKQNMRFKTLGLTLRTNLTTT